MRFTSGVKEWSRMGISVASSPSSPRQILSRCMRPARVSEKSLINSTTRPVTGVVSPPIGLGKRCVPVASVAFVASPVASALHTPKSTLKCVFQNLKRAVWREKSTRLARLLPPEHCSPDPGEVVHSPVWLLRNPGPRLERSEFKSRVWLRLLRCVPLRQLRHTA